MTAFDEAGIRQRDAQYKESQLVFGSAFRAEIDRRALLTAYDLQAARLREAERLLQDLSDTWWKSCSAEQIDQNKRDIDAFLTPNTQPSGADTAETKGERQ